MTDTSKHAPKVGAPDPELKNSPIFDSSDEHDPSLDLELETGVCYFNNESYTIGSYVCSAAFHRRSRGSRPGRRRDPAGCSSAWTAMPSS